MLVKKVSDLHGGDDIDFLREHCRFILSEYADDRIEEAIACYEQIISDVEFCTRFSGVKDDKSCNS